MFGIGLENTTPREQALEQVETREVKSRAGSRLPAEGTEEGVEIYLLPSCGLSKTQAELSLRQAVVKVHGALLTQVLAQSDAVSRRSQTMKQFILAPLLALTV